VNAAISGSIFAAPEDCWVMMALDLVLVFPVAQPVPALSLSDATDWG
jgi:hypothetical protein